ncbi:aminotransferase class IV [Marinobacter salinisoli]|uniref:Aminotransferase class IV n=1 Tax=Marinobacter salinisoli TaxID=2769486 RepID=A0ABX7MMP4_9GAMM|nr:aminotransferase class IV [Marinobacter salinisoli]QSP93492.1 aminotransferase class IV [Marinobacter salinisoli]
MLKLYWADESGLPAGDRGLAYGDGLFETIRMKGRQGVLLGRHVERMVRDAGRLAIPVTRQELISVCRQAADRFGAGPDDQGWVLKLTLTRGTGGRGYRPEPTAQPNLLVAASGLPPIPSPEGVWADFSPVKLTVNPLLAGIKSLNRLEQVMAARDLTDDRFEMLMLDSEGQLVEGTRTNLLVRFDQGWVTPPRTSLAVAGVLREWLLEQLRSRGETVAERPLAVSDVVGPDCRGLFLLNSVLGVVPVRGVADHELPVYSGLATIFDLNELLE